MDAEEKLKRTQFFVEASDYERYSLWKENHDKIEWVEDNMGCYRTIGQIESNEEILPVTVCFSFCQINGKYVCFYYATSRGVDWDMVDKYIEKWYPVKYDKETRRAMTDAQNFHHCLGFCINGD